MCPTGLSGARYCCGVRGKGESESKSRRPEFLSSEVGNPGRRTAGGPFPWRLNANARAPSKNRLQSSVITVRLMVGGGRGGVTQTSVILANCRR
jgi:hypothetical protein